MAEHTREDQVELQQAPEAMVTDLSLMGESMVVLPRDIFTLSSLHFLDLSDNFLSALPEEIGMLKNL